MTRGADVVDRGGDLAIGLLAQGAAILPLDADGMLALLGEAGVVEDEDPLGAGKGLRQVLAIALSITAQVLLPYFLRPAAARRAFASGG